MVNIGGYGALGSGDMVVFANSRSVGARVKLPTIVLDQRDGAPNGGLHSKPQLVYAGGYVRDIHCGAELAESSEAALLFQAGSIAAINYARVTISPR